MTRIVRQLLDFSRRSQLEEADCDLSELARRCSELFAPVADQAGITIALAGTERPIVVRGDAEALQQVFTNVVANAIDAMPSGGTLRVVLRLVDETPPAARRATPHARIDVEDGGAGMAPDVVAHAFDPFFTTKPAGSGTGLGLSVVDGIVREHGGWIAIASEPAVGTTVSIFLPVRS